MSITISRILILIKSRRIKSRRNINESRSSNFPTIRKQFGGRPTRINRATFEDRFGRDCGFCARFEGRECRSNLFSGPFCSCMRLSTRPSRYSGHELTASLSLSLFLLVPLHGVLPSPPTEPSGYQYLCRFAFVGIGTTRQKIAIPLLIPPPPYQLIVSRYFVRFFPFASFKKRKGKEEEWTDKDFSYENYILLFCYSRYVQYICYIIRVVNDTVNGCCRNYVFMYLYIYCLFVYTIF